MMHDHTLIQQRSKDHADLKAEIRTSLVFISNIPYKIGDDLMVMILKVCGSVELWDRSTGSKFQKEGKLAFGFCKFKSASDARNCVGILDGFQIYDKQLSVAVHELSKTTTKHNNEQETMVELRKKCRAQIMDIITNYNQDSNGKDLRSNTLRNKGCQCRKDSKKSGQSTEETKTVQSSDYTMKKLSDDEIYKMQAELGSGSADDLDNVVRLMSNLTVKGNIGQLLDHTPMNDKTNERFKPYPARRRTEEIYEAIRESAISFEEKERQSKSTFASSFPTPPHELSPNDDMYTTYLSDMPTLDMHTLDMHTSVSDFSTVSMSPQSLDPSSPQGFSSSNPPSPTDSTSMYSDVNNHLDNKSLKSYTETIGDISDKDMLALLYSCFTNEIGDAIAHVKPGNIVDSDLASSVVMEPQHQQQHPASTVVMEPQQQQQPPASAVVMEPQHQQQPPASSVVIEPRQQHQPTATIKPAGIISPPGLSNISNEVLTTNGLQETYQQVPATQQRTQQPAPQHMQQPAPQHMQQPAPQHMQQPASQHMQQPASQHMQQPAPQHMQQPAPQHMQQSAQQHTQQPVQQHTPSQHYTQQPTPQHTQQPAQQQTQQPVQQHTPSQHYTQQPTPQHTQQPAQQPAPQSSPLHTQTFINPMNEAPVVTVGHVVQHPHSPGLQYSHPIPSVGAQLNPYQAANPPQTCTMTNVLSTGHVTPSAPLATQPMSQVVSSGVEMPYMPLYPPATLSSYDYIHPGQAPVVTSPSNQQPPMYPGMPNDDQQQGLQNRRTPDVLVSSQPAHSVHPMRYPQMTPTVSTTPGPTPPSTAGSRMLPSQQPRPIQPKPVQLPAQQPIPIRVANPPTTVQAVPLQYWYPPCLPEDVEALLKKRCKVDQVQLSQWTTPDSDLDYPMHIAVMQGDKAHTLFLQALLERFVKEKCLEKNINVVNALRQTSLMLAVKGCHVDIVRMLISHGADPNLKGKMNKNATNEDTSALHIAVERLAEFPVSTIQCIQEFIKSPKLDKVLKNYKGVTALHHLVNMTSDKWLEIEALRAHNFTELPMQFLHKQEVMKNMKNTIKYMLVQGFDLCTQATGNGRTAFHSMIQSGDVDFVREVFYSTHSHAYKERLVRMADYSELTTFHIVMELRPPVIDEGRVLKLVDMFLPYVDDVTAKDLVGRKAIQLVYPPYKKKVNEVISQYHKYKARK